MAFVEAGLGALHDPLAAALAIAALFEAGRDRLPDGLLAVLDTPLGARLGLLHGALGPFPLGLFAIGPVPIGSSPIAFFGVVAIALVVLGVTVTVVGASAAVGPRAQGFIARDGQRFTLIDVAARDQSDREQRIQGMDSSEHVSSFRLWVRVQSPEVEHRKNHARGALP